MRDYSLHRRQRQVADTRQDLWDRANVRLAHAGRAIAGWAHADWAIASRAIADWTNADWAHAGRANFSRVHASRANASRANASHANASRAIATSAFTFPFPFTSAFTSASARASATGFAPRQSARPQHRTIPAPAAAGSGVYSPVMPNHRAVAGAAVRPIGQAAPRPVGQPRSFLRRALHRPLPSHPFRHPAPLPLPLIKPTVYRPVRQPAPPRTFRHLSHHILEPCAHALILRGKPLTSGVQTPACSPVPPTATAFLRRWLTNPFRAARLHSRLHQRPAPAAAPPYAPEPNRKPCVLNPLRRRPGNRRAA